MNCGEALRSVAPSTSHVTVPRLILFARCYSMRMLCCVSRTRGRTIPDTRRAGTSGCSSMMQAQPVRFSVPDVEAAATELIETGSVLLRNVLCPSVVRQMRARFKVDLEALVTGRRERKPNEGSGDGSTPNRNGYPDGPNRGPQRWFMSCDLVQPYLEVLEATPLLALMARVFGDDDIALTNIGNLRTRYAV